MAAETTFSSCISHPCPCHVAVGFQDVQSTHLGGGKPQGQAVPSLAAITFSDVFQGFRSFDTFFLPLLRMKALKTGGHLDMGGAHGEVAWEPPSELPELNFYPE